MKGVGRIKICFKNISLSAIFTLSMRPLISGGFSDKLLTMYLINILSVPGYVYHLDILNPEVIIDKCLW